MERRGYQYVVLFETAIVAHYHAEMSLSQDYKKLLLTALIS